MMNDSGTQGSRPVGDMIRESMEPMPELSRVRMRARVLAGIGSEGRMARARMLFTRTAIAFTTTATVLTGTGLAAASSLPGDALYPVKRATEEVRVAFAPAAQQGEILLEMVQSRIHEIADLVESDASEPAVERAAERFGEAASRAIESQPDPKTHQGIVREIEASVAEEPAAVQQRVDSQIPQPTPAPQPAPSPSNPSATPNPEPAPSPSPDPQGMPGTGGSGSPSGGTNGGSGSGPVSKWGS